MACENRKERCYEIIELNKKFHSLQAEKEIIIEQIKIAETKNKAKKRQFKILRGEDEVDE